MLDDQRRSSRATPFLLPMQRAGDMSMVKLDNNGRIIFFLLLGLLWSACWSCKPCHASDPVDSAEVELAIERAADYLLRSVNEDGSFVYRINMNPTVDVTPGYNVLRHAGGIYALSMVCEVSSNGFVRPALARSVSFLREHTFEPVPKMDDCLAVWSKPERVGVPQLQAKLGGTGLGLVAVISAKPFIPDPVPLSELQQMGQFLINMQKRDGSFYSKYIPSKWRPKDDRWVSLYYPGEAALGLLMLYEQDPNPQWLAGAEKALSYLARQRQGQQDIPADHWALLATGRLAAIRARQSRAPLEEIYLDHAIQVCETILSEQIVDTNRPTLVGGFSGQGLVTPSATRLEGLLSLHQALPREHPLRDRIETAAHLGIAFLLRAQVKEGVYGGAFPRAVIKLPLDAEGSDSFNQRVTEIRVDYVQHALSAMIQYRRCCR